MYEMVNKELMIKSCIIGDLTMQQTVEFLNTWEEGAKIGSLTMFFDNDGWVVLNKEHRLYETMLKLSETYLILSKDERTRIRENLTRFQEECRVLEKALIIREIKILDEQPINNYPLEQINAILTKHHNNEFLKNSGIYYYGFIQGKRAERQRKRQSVNA